MARTTVMAIAAATPTQPCNRSGFKFQSSGIKNSSQPSVVSPMQSEPLKPFNANAHPELACPVCYGDLRPNGSQLVCSGCDRAYPIVDGIPVLIPDRAERSST